MCVVQNFVTEVRDSICLFQFVSDPLGLHVIIVLHVVQLHVLSKQ